MMNTMIQAEGISKKYHIGAAASTATMRDKLGELISRPFRRGPRQPTSKEFWALQDINFTVNQGEVLGFVGHNGSGKSTLLRILCRISRPTFGHFSLYGRVGSLLEIGTGFHPDLTGRENVYLSASILGMKRREVAAKFDEIVAFAEVEQFIDTPVKFYSSGMYVRLAFAVATNLETEILLLDEVLGVGDYGFQQKSSAKLNEMIRDGRTVILVSHIADQVKNLCTRVIWLNHGKIVADDIPETVLPDYLASYQS
jgi:lipopolysaccharide transport system ATP-binding protein